jgi:UDP-N-acetyl-D-glucosamine dehydrogenase
VEHAAESHCVGVVGLGYVGLPLALAFVQAGSRVVGLDSDSRRVEAIRSAQSYVEDVPSEDLERAVSAGLLTASTNYDDLVQADAITICVPTPLDENRQPDLRPLIDAGTALSRVLRKGQLVVLESTTYPGTTRERLVPMLEESGLAAGRDFHVAFSPERVDPGRSDYTLRNTVKVVGGVTDDCAQAARELYERVCDEVLVVSSPEAAELSKLLENIFRSVNIALVNELAVLCDRMGIDIWEVVDAAATKPFGFMRFDPGPGMGGHCLPVDPFYLAWKAREYDFYTEFIELAGKINANMPYFCRSLISQALNHGAEKSLKGARVLMLGVSYKADVDDVRESPAEKIMQLLRKAGAEVEYHDPHVAEFDGLRSAEYAPESYDCVVIVTAHSSINYDDLVERAQVVVDLRNATGRNGSDNGKVWKL